MKEPWKSEILRKNNNSMEVEEKYKDKSWEGLMGFLTACHNSKSFKMHYNIWIQNMKLSQDPLLLLTLKC